MQVSKWGDSLAVRLPAKLVEALNLKEGDQIDLRIAGNHEVEVSRDTRTQDAIELMRHLRKPAPVGFKFDRLDANERNPE